MIYRKGVLNLSYDRALMIKILLLRKTKKKSKTPAVSENRILQNTRTNLRRFPFENIRRVKSFYCVILHPRSHTSYASFCVCAAESS